MALDGVDGVRRTLLGEKITLQMEREGPLDEASVRAVLENAGVSLVAVSVGQPSIL